MSDLFLSKEELIELTGVKRCDAQMNWLGRQGFMFKQRADAKVLVLRDHVKALMNPNNKETGLQPNWAGLKALKKGK